MGAVCRPAGFTHPGKAAIAFSEPNRVHVFEDINKATALEAAVLVEGRGIHERDWCLLFATATNKEAEHRKR
jgi:hypothetical protein